MTSKEQEIAFKKAIGNELPLSLLGSTIDWIRDNLNPDQVFDQSRLNQFVGNIAEPDEVFKEAELESWAKENGYSKQVEQG